ncbi:MAG: hypothetical protein J6B71_06765 [Clostridia bacterium]|nr:hypothetical protein [Clostridia bacterium]
MSKLFGKVFAKKFARCLDTGTILYYNITVPHQSLFMEALMGTLLQM